MQQAFELLLPAHNAHRHTPRSLNAMQVPHQVIDCCTLCLINQPVCLSF